MIERITGLVLGALSAYVIALEFPRVWPQHGLWDFGSFVASGRAARDGLNPYGVYPLTAHVSLPGFESWNPNLNPPISAVLFQVFDWADPTVSLRTWWWVSLACYVITAVLVLRRFGRSQPVSLGLWMFALAGFWDTLFLGQIYLPLVLASVVAWILLERGETVWAGVLIGLVVAIKPNFLVWPVLLFLSGHRTPAVVTLITAAVISAVPLAVYGPEVYRQWLELVASDSNRAAFLTNASLSGLAARAGVPALRLVFSAALLGSLALWAFWRRPSAMRASALALVASLLASPIGWIHYTLFLMPVILSQWHRPAMRLVGLLLIVPVPFVIDQFAKPTWIQVTTGSVYGWALVLCLVVLVVSDCRRDAAAGAHELQANPATS